MKPKPEDLTEVLRRLSLTTIAEHYEELGREAAREGLSHVEYLRRLAEAEAEAAARYERSVQRRTQAAHARQPSGDWAARMSSWKLRRSWRCS